MINKKFGIASFTSSILGILIAFVLSNFVPFIGNFSIIILFVCCLVGILFYFLQRKIQPTKISTAGFILGIIGVILGIYISAFVFNPIYDPLICTFGGCVHKQDLWAGRIISEAQTKADCDKIKWRAPSFRRDTCYATLVKVPGDIEFCELIESGHSKDACYYNNALKFEDTKLCDRIVDKAFFSIPECYDKVYRVIDQRAYSDGDPYLCEEIPIEEKKQACYDRSISQFMPHGGSYLSQNSNLCKKLSTDELKEDCYSTIKEWESGPKLEIEVSR